MMRTFVDDVDRAWERLQEVRHLSARQWGEESDFGEPGGPKDKAEKEAECQLQDAGRDLEREHQELRRLAVGEVESYYGEWPPKARVLASLVQIAHLDVDDDIDWGAAEAAVEFAYKRRERRASADIAWCARNLPIESSMHTWLIRRRRACHRQLTG